MEAEGTHFKSSIHADLPERHVRAAFGKTEPLLPLTLAPASSAMQLLLSFASNLLIHVSYDS